MRISEIAHLTPGRETNRRMFLLLRIGLTSALLVTFACSASGASDELEARRATNAFYRVYLRLHPSGVPTKEQQVHLRRIISQRLAILLQRAAAAEQKYFETMKGEAPPLVEGDLFTSLFEGASSFAVNSCDTRRESATCLVDLKHIDPRDRSVVAWRDRVFLIRGQGGWAVDDIEFLGDWQFMHKGRLQGLLKEVIEEGNADQH